MAIQLYINSKKGKQKYFYCCPIKGKWAFPGGFLHLDESAEGGARQTAVWQTGMTRATST